ncbi:hypothetical protein Cgig2_006839 [Carnegiea gigantea]|uniref:Uncharacterized protein n=1 Tax=Carnegiea gigantea TaxID=171969 RepID=A0A9Q1GHZ7_9CARY|nr:hypothetical protein Cgig2_006839 [Carnegiea gigantea]
MLRVLQGRALRSLELAFAELRSWVWLYVDRIFEARFRPKARSGRVQKPIARKRAQRWGRRMRAWPFRGRSPFRMVTSRGDILRYAVERGRRVGRGARFYGRSLSSVLVGLRWSSFEVWMSCVDHELRETQFRGQAIAVEVHGLLDDESEKRERKMNQGLFPNFANSNQVAKSI